MRPIAAVVFAFALSAGSGLLCPGSAEATVYVPCGAYINSYVWSNPPGTVFQLAGSSWAPCTYWGGQGFNTKSYDVFQGDCSSSLGANTILDGGYQSRPVTAGTAPYGGDGSTGVVLQCLTVQNYQPSYSGQSAAMIYTWNGWTVQNCTLRGSGGFAIEVDGGAVLQNCLITGNGEGGVKGNQQLWGTSGTPLIIGNEISYNNTHWDDLNWAAAGIKMAQSNANIYNNYIHDNYANGVWFDVDSWNVVINGNTIVNNAAEGIRFEVSNGATISDNVINNNNYVGFYSGGAIEISSSANANVYHNNIVVAAGYGNGIEIQSDCRGDAQWEYGTTISGNTVTFLGWPGNNGAEGFDDNTHLGSWCSWLPHPWSQTNNWAHDNAYYVTNTGIGHWIWGWTVYSPLYTLWAIQQQYGQEYNSWVTTGYGGVGGCTHTGCTGSGW